jgi:hypothetical protein
MRWAGNIARMKEKLNACRALVGKRGQRPLGSRRRRLEDATKMDIREIEWGDMGWIHSFIQA